MANEIKLLFGVTLGLIITLSIVLALNDLKRSHKKYHSIWDYILNFCVMIAGMIGVVMALYVIAFFSNIDDTVSNHFA